MAFRGERSWSCQVKKRRTVTMASVFKPQNVTRFSITVVEEKKVMKINEERIEKQRSCWLYLPLWPKFQNKFLFLFEKQSSWNKSESTRLRHHRKVGLFLHEHEMSKPFFLCHVEKEKENISGSHICHSHLLAENFYQVARWRLYQIVNFWTLINGTSTTILLLLLIIIIIVIIIILFYLCQKIDIMLKVFGPFNKCFDWVFESVLTNNECLSL